MGLVHLIPTCFCVDIPVYLFSNVRWKEEIMKMLMVLAVLKIILESLCLFTSSGPG